MWSNFSDVTRKLKDIAIELAQPHYDNDNHCQEQQRVGLDDGTGGAYQRSGVRQTLHGHDGVRADCQGNSRSQVGVSGPVAPPTRKAAAPSDITLKPPLRQPQASSISGTDIDGVTTCAGDDGKQKPLNLSLSGGDMRSAWKTLPPTVAVGGTAGAMDMHEHEGRISELLLQVQRVSEEKQQLERQLATHKEKVAEANKKTVKFYEDKIALLQTELASQKKLSNELDEKLAFYVRECDELQKEVQRLKEHEKTLTQKDQRAEDAEAEGRKLLAAQGEQCIETLQHVKSLEATRSALTEQVKDDVLASSFSAESSANNNKALVVPTNVGELKELYKRVNTLEQENLAIVRQKEELAFVLKKVSFLLCASFEEVENILNFSHDQTQLLMEFIQRRENERRVMRQDEEEKKGKKNGSRTEQNEYEEEMKKAAVMMATKKEENGKVTMPILEKPVTPTPGTQVDAVSHSNEDVIQHISLKLENDNNVGQMALSRSHCEQQSSEMVDKLTRELRDAEHQLGKFKEQQAALQEEIERLRKCLADSNSEVKKRSEELKLREERVADLESSLAEAQQTLGGYDSSLVKALTARKRELEVECTQKDEVMQQLEHIVSDCIVRANIELPQLRGTGACASFSDKLTLLASEFNRLFDAAKNLEQREKEWGRTYEQARNVNETLTQQVTEAWKTIGTLREELSLRDQSLVSLKKQAQAELQQHHEAQRQLTSVMNELQALKEEKSTWEASVAGSKAVETCQEKLVTMRADMDTLRRALQEREDELTQAQRGMETLQEVLDTFTRNRARDVEERTAELHVEIDQLREELSLAEVQRQRHQDEIDELNANHIQEIAAKNLEIKSLYRKHAELRTALEETATQLNGSMLIDKRVISHITVNFIHAFVAQRPEADEMLKVLSGLLNWDEATQEKAGLLPGPTNPKIGQQQQRRGGLIGGIVSTVWGGSGSGKAKSDSKGSSSPSIAELWVEFLMRESESVLAEEKDLSSAAALPLANEATEKKEKGTNDSKNLQE